MMLMEPAQEEAEPEKVTKSPRSSKQKLAQEKFYWVQAAEGWCPQIFPIEVFLCCINY